jgi:hypothetical protein
MGGRRTGVLTIGSSEGIALGNSGPLHSRALAEDNFVGESSATLSQMSFDTRAIMSFDISTLILPHASSRRRRACIRVQVLVCRLERCPPWGVQVEHLKHGNAHAKIDDLISAARRRSSGFGTDCLAAA